MDEVNTPTEQPDAAAPRNRRTAGGREAKRAARAARSGGAARRLLERFK